MLRDSPTCYTKCFSIKRHEMSGTRKKIVFQTVDRRRIPLLNFLCHTLKRKSRHSALMKRMHPTFTFSTIPFAEKKRGRTDKCAQEKKQQRRALPFPFPKNIQECREMCFFQRGTLGRNMGKKLANRESPDPKAIAITLARERKIV